MWRGIIVLWKRAFGGPSVSDGDGSSYDQKAGVRSIDRLGVPSLHRGKHKSLANKETQEVDLQGGRRLFSGGRVGSTWGDGFTDHLPTIPTPARQPLDEPHTTDQSVWLLSLPSWQGRRECPPQKVRVRKVRVEPSTASLWSLPSSFHETQCPTTEHLRS